ncbi:MAG: glycosyltransferase [Desulfurococcales archaeon]|nr:glycosyltransferase [Desulfurococcales archaeon]
MQRIVLSMITYNSIKRRGRRLLEMVLESSLQVPYDTIIVVDDGYDGTGDFIRTWAGEHGKEVFITRSRVDRGVVTRATARQTAIDLFLEAYTSEWLMFLDDDAVLLEGWWREAKEYISEDRVGIIWGVNRDLLEPERNLEKKIKGFRLRGGLHDTLLRREALQEIPPIPATLHIYEDAWIYWNMTCRGWEYRIVETGCIHYGGDDPFLHSDPRAVYEAYRLLGLVEDYRDDAVRDYQGVVKPFINVVRPLLGLLVKMPAALRRRTAGRLVKMQFNKARARWHQAMARLKYGPPRNPCELLLRDTTI